MTSLFDFAEEDEDPVSDSVAGDAPPVELATRLDPNVGEPESGVRVAGPEVPSQGTGQVAPASYRDGLLEQIIRDSAVLREDPIYHEPSTEFYERRIAQYRQAIIDLDERSRRT
jgi:hypothetical protein